MSSFLCALYSQSLARRSESVKGEKLMSDERLRLILQALDTKNQWFGGPTAAGSLRNVSLDLAVR